VQTNINAALARLDCATAHETPTPPLRARRAVDSTFMSEFGVIKRDAVRRMVFDWSVA
jgi:hypothetical protein